MGGCRRHGGHDAGDVASRVAVEELNAIPAPASAAELLASCEAHMVIANSRLRQLADERGALIGTTIAILLVFGGSYACVWSGDSRIYRIRGAAIEQISMDHTEIQELISEGKIGTEEAATWPHRNAVTRAIGVFESPELEIKSGMLEPGDGFVICSDGLTAHVSDEEILALAGKNPAQVACDLLLQLTLDRGASDNVTLVIVQVGAVSTVRAGQE
ncbi:PP2C family protein-serine/threonine phosphatase [Rhodopseudomonas sp. RCAM05734]|uniref:PP2C family protein-serine/threonine phosphatase n=1 Tax=Rhodopseudomonas sp. RCAM05734 TaxID=3457549 RepID=UPI0040449498